MSLFDELKRRNVLRVAFAYVAVAWLVIQVAETLLPIFGLEETAARLVVIAFAIGFVPILVLSWLFQWSPDGLRWDRDARRVEGATPWAASRLDHIIIVALTAAVAYFAVDKFIVDPARDARLAESAARLGRAEARAASYGQRSLAVLPFGSSDPDQVYFAEGIAQELLNTLARIPEIRVAAANSAFSFKDTDATIREIGETLSVDYILDGDVRTSGDDVRITVRLVDVPADALVWSERYERKLEDVFAIQDEISSRVVEGLEVTLLGSVPGVRKTNPEAYRLYLQANYLMRTTRRVREEAEPLLRRALELDPEYVPALLGLARVYNRRSQDEDRERFRALARATVDEALAIDPDNGLGHAWLGWFAVYYDRDMEAGAREYELALRLDPTNETSVHGLLQVAREYGLYEEAIVLGRYAVRRDPVCARCYVQLGVSCFVAGKLAAAEAALGTAETLNTDPDMEIRLVRGLIPLLRGDAVAALEIFETLPEGTEHRILGRALASHSLGRTADFEAALADLRASDEANRWLAPAYAWAGDADRAFEAIAEHETTGDPTYIWISALQDPVYASLHDDPRWHELRRRRGVSPEQLAEIGFDLKLPEVITSAVE